MYSNLWSRLRGDKVDKDDSKLFHDIVKNDNFTLEDVLNAKDFFTLCSKQNIDFVLCFHEDRNLLKVLEYLLTEPGESDSSDRKFKFPYRCNHLVNSNAQVLSDRLLEDKYLDAIFSFLDRKQNNAVVAGYFCKLVKVLKDRDLSKIVKYFERKGLKLVVDKFLMNLENPSVVAALASLGWENTAKLNQDWLVNGELIPKLIESLCSDKTRSERKGKCSALIALATNGYVVNEDGSDGCKCKLFVELEKEENIKRIIELVFVEESDLFGDIVMIILVLLIKLENYHSVKKQTQKVSDDLDSEIEDDIEEEMEKEPIVRCLAGKMANIKEMLQKLNSPGTTVLGDKRLKLIELVVTALRTNAETMNKKIIENGLIKTVLYVYLKYPWHNYVHILISQMVARIVEKDVFRLKKTLFLESDIVSVLSKSIDANSAYHSENGANLGSKVHTFRMIHCIKLQAQKDETVQHFCGRSEKWKDCLRFFVQSQEIYAKKIGDANIDCLMNNRRRDYGNVYFG